MTFCDTAIPVLTQQLRRQRPQPAAPAPTSRPPPPDEEGWTKALTRTRKEAFCGPTPEGPTFVATETTSPLEFFLQFFLPSLFRDIAKWTRTSDLLTSKNEEAISEEEMVSYQNNHCNRQTASNHAVLVRPSWAEE